VEVATAAPPGTPATEVEGVEVVGPDEVSGDDNGNTPDLTSVDPPDEESPGFVSDDTAAGVLSDLSESSVRSPKLRILSLHWSALRLRRRGSSMICFHDMRGLVPAGMLRC
jgi:hypothetical protein